MIKTIQKILENEDLASVLLKPENNYPFPRLLVAIGNDYKQREQLLTIQAIPQNFGQSKEGTDYHRVELHFSFPFSIKEEALRDGCSLALFLNSIIDLPGFSVDELKNKFYYRYVYFENEKRLDSTILIANIGIILLLLELFTPTLERISLKKSTFNELLEEVIQIYSSNLKN